MTTTELADDLVEALRVLVRSGLLQQVAVAFAGGGPGRCRHGQLRHSIERPESLLRSEILFYTPYTTLMRTTAKETREIGRRTAMKPWVCPWPCAGGRPPGSPDYDREGGVFSDPIANRAGLMGLKGVFRSDIRLPRNALPSTIRNLWKPMRGFSAKSRPRYQK